MTLNSRIIRRLFALALVVLAGAGGSRVARAQPNNDPFDRVIGQPANDMAAAFAIRQAAMIQQVDQQVFGRLGGPGPARIKLDSLLLLRIDDLERVCGISEDQKKKLRLAGRGDIKRFFDRVEELKSGFEQGRTPPNANIFQETQPLAAELGTGMFGEHSIYAKTIKRTLSDEQAARFECVSRERKVERYRATVAWFVVHLDNGLGLTDDQRRRLVELLETETRPPNKFGHGDYWYLLLQTARIPEAKIKPILDAPQWRLLSRQFAQARGMEKWLKANGVVPDDEKEDAAAAQSAARSRPLIPAAAMRKSVPRVNAAEKPVNSTQRPVSPRE